MVPPITKERKDNMIKLKIGAQAKAVKVRDVIEQNGVSLCRNEFGEVAMELRFPGVAPVVLSENEMWSIRETLRRDVRQGDRACDVFDRSASIDSEGNLEARFSDKERARAVRLSAIDREEVGDFLSALLADWGEHQAEFEKAEQEIEAENARLAAEGKVKGKPGRPPKAKAED